MKLLVTGAAGFIGMHVCQRLLARGDEVVGVDNLNAYYDVGLKQARLQRLEAHPGFSFVRLDIADRQGMAELFARERPPRVIHLAAQAGVRYSLDHPHAYVDSNLAGFVNLLEGCRASGVEHLVYASSSSVYGMNTHVPFSTGDRVDHPISLYAATKKANELMAHTYSHLFGIPCTGLRFFTVYGPWGRPDMAYFGFTRNILRGEPIDVFNHGAMQRDFTYIDDIVEGVLRVAERIPAPRQAPGSNAVAPYQLYNIGNHAPITLDRFIRAIENATGKTALRHDQPMQPGDVPITYADVDDLARDVGFKPATGIEEGIARFVAWYRDYYAA